MTRARDLADGKFVSLDISGDIDVDGTTNLDAVDIDSAVDINGVVHVSPNTSGKDTFELSTNAVDEGRLRIKNVDTTTVQIRAGGDSYFNGGDVSIGNTSPDARLHVLDTSLPQTKIAYDSDRYMNIEHATIYNVSGASQSNSLKIIVHNKKCKTNEVCSINEIDSNIKFELQRSILAKAAALELETKKSKK